MPKQKLHPIKWVSSYRPCSEARKSSGRRSLRKLGKLTRRRRSSCSPAQRAQHAGLPSPPWGRSTVRTTRRSISTPHSFRISSGCDVGSKSCQFSQAYVITHEVGHHVQNLLG